MDVSFYRQRLPRKIEDFLVCLSKKMPRQIVIYLSSGLFIWEAGRDVCRDGTFAGKGRLPGRDVCRDGTFAGTGRLPGRDLCRNGRLNGISLCIYIYLICPVPFIWKEFCRDVFRLVPAMRDRG